MISEEIMQNQRYGTCGYCGMTWNRVKPHDTYYTDSEACFALCETCWIELKTPEARLPYYRQLWVENGKWSINQSEHLKHWQQIRKAVMNEP